MHKILVIYCNIFSFKLSFIKQYDFHEKIFRNYLQTKLTFLMNKELHLNWKLVYGNLKISFCCKNIFKVFIYFIFILLYLYTSYLYTLKIILIVLLCNNKKKN